MSTVIKLTVEWTVEGTLIVGTVVKWFSVLAKTGKATGTLR